MYRLDDAAKERLWDKVKKTRGCWHWTAFVGKYGQFKVQGRQWKAHRVVWEQINGPLPEGSFLRDNCGDNACVRPDHWTLTTWTKQRRDPHNLSEHRWLAKDVVGKYGDGKPAECLKCGHVFKADDFNTDGLGKVIELLYCFRCI